MKIQFPSRDFDDGVAAVCSGLASEDQARALNELLRSDGRALDEYILRAELHARLASDSDLFAPTAPDTGDLSESGPTPPQGLSRPTFIRRSARRKSIWVVAVAASLAAVVLGVWSWRVLQAPSKAVATSRAVAMLNQTVDARWATSAQDPQSGAPLEPGWLNLEAGLAQVVFYNGARVAIEGPAEVKLVSPSQAYCRRGKITADVPPQALEFRIDTPHGTASDLGAAFGLEVTERRTELHVFRGEVTLQAAAGNPDHALKEGSGAVIESGGASHRIAADRAAFASLFDLKAKSLAAMALRIDHWRRSGQRLNSSPSLLARFDFDQEGSTSWQLRNLSEWPVATGEATIVGCQWGEGRWPAKRGLEFQSVSDRVRINVPGEFEAVTLSAWARVQGLDRRLNSLFMCDGFDPGTLHWLIRSDGVLGLTVVGEGAGNFQIVASARELTLDQLGMWLHLAVVVDGPAGVATHYVNGRPVGESVLRIEPPYRIGAAELGNWNGKGFPKDDPFMIRNFSGAMDEFCLFSRALSPREIRALYAQGRPEMEAVALRE